MKKVLTTPLPTSSHPQEGSQVLWFVVLDPTTPTGKESQEPVHKGQGMKDQVVAQLIAGTLLVEERAHQDLWEQKFKSMEQQKNNLLQEHLLEAEQGQEAHCSQQGSTAGIQGQSRFGGSCQHSEEGGQAQVQGT